MIPADIGISLLDILERVAGTGLFLFMPESIPKTAQINSYCSQIQFLLWHNFIHLPAVRSTAIGKFQEWEGDFGDLKRIFYKSNQAGLIFYPLHQFSLKIILHHCSPLMHLYFTEGMLKCRWLKWWQNYVTRYQYNGDRWVLFVFFLNTTMNLGSHNRLGKVLNTADHKYRI